MLQSVFKLNKIIPEHIHKLVELRKKNMPNASANIDTFRVMMDDNKSRFGSVGTEKNYSIYPNEFATPLRMELVNYYKQYNIKESQIVVGNGCTELIEVILRSILSPNEDSVIIAQPAEPIWKETAILNNAGIIEVKLEEDLSIPLSVLYNLITENTKAIILSNPNPYLGSLISPLELSQLLNKFSGLVIVDETSIDCEPGESVLHLLNAHANLVILQTFSQLWGLAALRIGVAYMHADFANIVQVIKPRFSVNQVAQEHALRALFLGDYKRGLLTNLIEQRTALMEALNQFSFVKSILPPHANFLTVYVKDAPYVYEYLMQEKIQVALLDENIFNNKAALRITVGTEDENKILIAALKEIDVQNSSIKKLFKAIAGTLTKVGVLVGLVRKMF